VDLDSEFLLAAEIQAATEPDTESLLSSVSKAQEHLAAAGSEQPIEEVVADKGYHKNQTLADAEAEDLRSYIPEPESRYQRTWIDKPPEQREAVLKNRRRMRGSRGKRLNRKRSEVVERSFAHTCETGGGRRSFCRREPSH